MNRELELRASQAIFAARLFESALHNSGPWTISWGPHEVEAVRSETSDGITFQAVIPSACYLTEPEPNAVLRCRGEVMAMRSIDFPGDTSFMVTWSLVASVARHASV